MSVLMRDRYGYEDDDDRQYHQQVKDEALRIARHEAGRFLRRCVLTICAALAILLSAAAAVTAWQGLPLYTGGAWLACSLVIFGLLKPALGPARGKA